jgi:crotonobetainyl-CoA:carnitine CoA-transferase CaiB-like acyl-CoA transferase
MLEDIKILSFTHFLQGPAATQILADLGADVIKIEPTQGAFERHWSAPDAFLDGESVFFLLAGRNQRSLSVDLRSEEGKEAIWKLIVRADVILESFRPGAMERLGFGYEQVSEAKPDIVYCSFSGYGSTGPYQKRPGQDVLIQALSGMAMLNGQRDDPPIPVGASMVDQHAAIIGAFGVLAALYERRDTGKGKRVESNLLSAALDLQIEPLSYYLNGTKYYDRSETGVSSRFYKAPYGVFETTDGYICISLTPTDKLAEAFDDDSFLAWAPAEQFEAREEINAKVAAHLKRNSTEHWYAAFEEMGVWHAPVNTYREVENDPQVAWNGSITSFEHPKAGTVRLLSHPVRYDGEAPPLRRTPPDLGEHTEEILLGLGYDEETVEELKAKGVVVAKNR